MESNKASGFQYYDIASTGPANYGSQNFEKIETLQEIATSVIAAFEEYAKSYDIANKDQTVGKDGMPFKYFYGSMDASLPHTPATALDLIKLFCEGYKDPKHAGSIEMVFPKIKEVSKFMEGKDDLLKGDKDGFWHSSNPLVKELHKLLGFAGRTKEIKFMAPAMEATKIYDARNATLVERTEQIPVAEEFAPYIFYLIGYWSPTKERIKECYTGLVKKKMGESERQFEVHGFPNVWPYLTSFRPTRTRQSLLRSVGLTGPSGGNGPSKKQADIRRAIPGNLSQLLIAVNGESFNGAEVAGQARTAWRVHTLAKDVSACAKGVGKRNSLGKPAPLFPAPSNIMECMSKLCAKGQGPFVSTVIEDWRSAVGTLERGSAERVKCLEDAYLKLWNKFDTHYKN